jgi:hypothetical protein
MNQLIQRAMRALHDEGSRQRLEHGWATVRFDDLLPSQKNSIEMQVLAVFGSLREPTAEMVVAGYEASLKGDVLKAWHAMVDAIGESPEEGG